MKRTRRNWIFFLMIALAVAALVYCRIPSEPSYERKTFTQWIQQMNTLRSENERNKAKEVVRKLGSNSTPLLLHWLKEEDGPTLTERADEAREKILFWLMRHKLIANHSVTGLTFSIHHRGLALMALPELDPEAKKKLTAKLIPLLTDKNRDNSISELAGTAFLGLSNLAPESITPLISALTNRTDDYAWMLAAGTLSKIGPDAKAAIPQLQLRLHDKNLNVRLSAANAIGKLGGDPDTFLPVLTQALSQTTADSWDFILELLTEYKEHAKPAVPILLRKLNALPKSNNPEQAMYRWQIINALQQIDPKVAQPFIETNLPDAATFTF